MPQGSDLPLTIIGVIVSVSDETMTSLVTVSLTREDARALLAAAAFGRAVEIRYPVEKKEEGER
jgi:hypothetical protein